MMMSSFTLWASDTFTLLATFLPTEVMASQTVARNLLLLFSMVPVGITQA
jgi:hypothetical protein